MNKFGISFILQNAFVLGLAAAVFLGSSGFTILASAFEASVVNVVAKIEPPPPQCGALSIGYWNNHEGCAQGEGESIWAADINNLSTRFSDVFATSTGGEMCESLWIPNCPSGGDTDSKLCRAKAHTLANELNMVSGRLDPRALLAGAYDGASAFSNLGLAADSQAQEALVIIERVLANPFATRAELTDAAYVAERIYTFYEEENPKAPQCVYSSAEWDEYQWDQSHRYGAPNENLFEGLQAGGEVGELKDMGVTDSGSTAAAFYLEGEEFEEEKEEQDGEFVLIQDNSLMSIGSPFSPPQILGQFDSDSSAPAFSLELATEDEEPDEKPPVPEESHTEGGTESPPLDLAPLSENDSDSSAPAFGSPELFEFEGLAETDSDSSSAAFKLAPEG